MNKTRICALIAAVITFSFTAASADYNKYNDMDFVNVSNRTMEEVAASCNMSFEDFVKEYSLPSDMPKDTNETAGFYSLTVKGAEKLYQTSFNEMKTQLGWDDSVTEDTLWIDAEDCVLLKNYIAEFNINEFRTMFQLDNSVTEDTKFADVRDIVEKYGLYYGGVLSYYTPDAILVMANGKYLDFDVAPTIINDRTMVPLRVIFENLHATVDWDENTQTISAVSGEDKISMQIGQEFMLVNDKQISLDSPAVIINSRTLVPARAVAEALNAKVNWNDKTKTVVIHK